jgi:hypothetical protein
VRTECRLVLHYPPLNKDRGSYSSKATPARLVFVRPSEGTGCATHSPIREGACKIRSGDSRRYSAHSSRSASALLKTLDGLRPQPLTSEHCCPCATVGEDSVAALGAGGHAVRCEVKRQRFE